MEFWGIEVKSGQLFEVNVGEGKVLHLSQASLGEIKKGNESVCLHVTVEGKKLVLGTLHSERLPQQLFDLVFDKDFQISHNWKNGSVYFYGYKADQPIDDHDTESEDFDSEDEEEDLQLPISNGKQEAKKEEKAAVSDKKDGAAKGSATGKQKVKIMEPEKDAKADSDDDDDSDDSDAMSEDSDSEEDNNDSSDDDDEEEDSDEEEETPKKQQSGKKRPNESAKTPSTDKKAKVAVTPQKTEGKKGGVHVATPHPSKQAAAKTPANKSNQKSPASEGAHSCKPCNRTFKSENALQSHNQAKHK